MTAILCSFIKTCKNYSKECYKCKWNSNVEIKDYLIIETEDGKVIRYLTAVSGQE